jgi:hypothetical protein
MEWNMYCPFCDKYINYWPNCSPSTNKDYYNFFTLERGHGKYKVRQFVHNSCYEEFISQQKQRKIMNEDNTKNS